MAKANWKKDDAEVEQRVYTRATDRAFDETIEILSIAFAVFAAAFALIEFFYRKDQIEKGVKESFKEEGKDYRLQLTNAQRAQEDNARDDIYRACLIYCNIALYIYNSRFLCNGNIEKFTDPIQDLASSKSSKGLIQKDEDSSNFKYSPHILMEVINIQESAAETLKLYIGNSLTKIQIESSLLSDKNEEEKYQLERESKNIKIHALYGEVCCDIAYFYCDFRYKRSINDKGLAMINKHYQVFLNNREQWIENEIVKHNEGRSDFSTRLISILDNCIVIEIVLKALKPTCANDFNKFLATKLSDLSITAKYIVDIKSRVTEFYDNKNKIERNSGLLDYIRR